MQVTQEQIGAQLYPGCMLMHAEMIPKHPEISIGFISCLYPLLLQEVITTGNVCPFHNTTRIQSQMSLLELVYHKQATTAGNMSLVTVTGTLVLSTL